MGDKLKHVLELKGFYVQPVVCKTLKYLGSRGYATLQHLEKVCLQPDRYLFMNKRKIASADEVKRKRREAMKKEIYKELDVKKLLTSIDPTKVKPTKVTKVVSSKHDQLQDGVQKAAKKILTDFKTTFRFYVVVISLILITTVPTSILYCWFNPVHREKTSKFSPQWGKCLDIILDPMDDDTKRNAGLDVLPVNRQMSDNVLKENVSTYKNDIKKSLVMTQSEIKDLENKKG